MVRQKCLGHRAKLRVLSVCWSVWLSHPADTVEPRPFWSSDPVVCLTVAIWRLQSLWSDRWWTGHRDVLTSCRWETHISAFLECLTSCKVSSKPKRQNCACQLVFHFPLWKFCPNGIGIKIRNSKLKKTSTLCINKNGIYNSWIWYCQHQSIGNIAVPQMYPSKLKVQTFFYK